MNHFQHILQRQRLEIEPVAGVIVSGDGFRVAIDHDGFKPCFSQRERGMDARVIKLDSLPNSVGT